MARVAADADWQSDLERWFEPFRERLGNKVQRTMARHYVRGLMSESPRKSIEPMAERVLPGKSQNLHHFISVSAWGRESLGAALVEKANELVGGPGSHLVVDDTNLHKKGRLSVGVARQYSSEVGKLDNCQSLVSLTMARGEVPVPVGLELYMPEEWIDDAERRKRCGVPEELAYRPKWQIALEEIDRIMACGAAFSDVLSDVGYGRNAEFRRGLSERKLRWAVGIDAHQRVYPSTTRINPPSPNSRAKHPVPSRTSMSAREMIDSLGPEAFRKITWRTGTKGPLSGRFAAVRVRVADGPRIAHSKRLPGKQAWLVCEWRANDEKKYYLSNLPRKARRRELIRMIKARWICEQAHQQMKEELGLGHFEGRSWNGLRRHALLTMIAFAYLQYRRLGGKKRALPVAHRRSQACRR